jgi:adenosine deaminase
VSGTIEHFIDGLPKAELHLHIEGTLEPEMVFALAERNRIKLPYASIEALRAAYRFTDLQDFLNLYYQAAQVLVTERDFFDLTRAYLARAAADGVRHAEIFFDPQTHTKRGVPLAAVIHGITGALAEAERERGLTSRLILCFLRDLDAADAMATLEAALPFRGHIAGVGLDSAEAGNPPAKFTEVFARARALGFKVVAHAGEEGPAAYVAAALDDLGAQRIDHGVRSIDDATLVARLARSQVPLTVCPLSNQYLKVTPDLSRHPLRELMAAGVLVTINSDDPAYFGGYVNANYRAVQKAFDLSRAELVGLARASFVASWLDAGAKEKRIAEVEAYAQAG